jgi:cyclopropane-fatty-acyl-phospholipid synthase
MQPTDVRKSRIEQFLASADVRPNGDRPWDIQIRNDGLFTRILSQGSLGLGESYMDGWWDCDGLDEFFCRILRADLDAKVLGITVSEEQAHFARETCRGLPIQIRYQDYRSLEGTFDRILCVGMFEHVGPKNYAAFVGVARRCLKEDGLFLLHTIGVQQTTARCDPWLTRYIFPNSKLPSAREICAAVEGRFIVEDWQNLGAHYDKTLMHWFRNFQDNWSSLRDGCDERFFRMWKYYLLSCAGASRARVNQLWQIVLSPRGVAGGYRIARD